MSTLREQGWVVGKWHPPVVEPVPPALAVYPSAECGTPICLVTPLDRRTESDDANARLIAAAPELLEACKALVDYDNGKLPPYELQDVINAARAAIAKAEGRQ